MTLNFNVEKDGKVTAFHKVMFSLLHKDILDCKNDTDMLTEELLLLEYMYIDFQPSQKLFHLMEKLLQDYITTK